MYAHVTIIKNLLTYLLTLEQWVNYITAPIPKGANIKCVDQIEGCGNRE